MKPAPRHLHGRLFACVIFVLCSEAWAGTGPVVTEFTEMWQIPGEETRECRFDGVVLYADLDWNALWVRRGG